MKPVITVNPTTCLQDEVLNIRAQGLVPGNSYSLVALTRLPAEVTEVGIGHFMADEHGEVDLTRMPSLGGSYSGIQAMGLFTHASKHRAKGVKGKVGGGDLRNQQDVTKPDVVQLRLLKGHHNEESAVAQDGVLAETEARRLYMAPGVRRVPVREGRIRATLFIPEGPGPHPAVVDMWGFFGGLFESRSALLASRGIMSLALAYCSFEDLPRTFYDLELQYFIEAVEYLYALPDVDRTRLGVVGTSKGAELALALATECRKIKKVLTVGGIHFLMLTKLHLKDRVMEGHQLVWKTLVTDADGTHPGTGAPPFEDVNPQSIFEIERNPDCEILLVAGTEDTSNPSIKSARYLQKKLTAMGQGHRVHVLALPGAGHVINPPYSAFVYSYFYKPTGDVFVAGGQPDLHAAGQLKAWREMVKFCSSSTYAPTGRL